jgi:hypothetical protein
VSEPLTHSLTAHSRSFAAHSRDIRHFSVSVSENEQRLSNLDLRE